MRRVTTLTLIAGLALAGCAQPKAEPTAASTRTVTDVTGQQVQVPASPKRVLALSEQDLDASLALDVKPVGTVNGRGQQKPPAYLGDKVNGIAVVGDVAKPTMDKVIEANPDLILAGGVTDQQILDQLRKVVPATVVTYKPEEDWKAAFKRQAEALGKSEKDAMAAYDKRVTEIKGKIKAETVSIVRWNPQGPTIMQTGQFASLVAADLGLKRPAGQQEKGFSHSAPLSLEQLARIDADWIFMGTLNADGRSAFEKIKSTPAFQQLGAVKNNRLTMVDGTIWTSRGGPLAANIVLDDIAKALKA